MDELDYDRRDGEELPSIRGLSRPGKLAYLPPYLQETSPQKLRKVWSPFVTEYNRIVQDPRRTPTPLKPFISKERQFELGFHRPQKNQHYLNIKLDLPDEYGINRKIYVHLCKENFAVGALAGTLIGATTGLYYPEILRIPPHLTYTYRQVFAKNLKGLARTAFSGTFMTATLTRKLITRAIIGGFLYDAIKRNFDQAGYTNQYLNAGGAGALCGFAFGIRGGIANACAATGITAAFSVLSEVIPSRLSDTNLD